jgi:hypothetical protein
MLSVTIHKDISEYQEKVVGKLSARTLACVAGGLLASIAAAAGVYFGLGIPVSDGDSAGHGRLDAVLARRLLAPQGMKAEKFLPLYIEHAMGDGKLAYSTAPRMGSVAGKVKCPKTDRKARKKSRKKGAERREPTQEA